MQIIWKINKKFEIWQGKIKQTNKKQQQQRQEKKKPSYSQRQGQYYDIYIKKICLTLNKPRKNEEGALNL